MRCYALLSLFAAAVVSGAGADSEMVIWQLGEQDGAYAEFAIAGNHAAYAEIFPGDAKIRGTDLRPRSSCPFILPGPADQWAGSKSHTLAAEFDLADASAPGYELKLGFSDTHGSVPPAIEISVNGRSGAIALPSGSGGPSLSNAALGKAHTIAIPLAASLLRQGNNKIEIRSISGSWLLWDYIRLATSGALEQPGVLELRANGTPFLARRHGKLFSIVEVHARCAPGTGELSISIEHGVKHGHISAVPDLLGAASVELFIEEIRAPCDATVTASSHGRSVSTSCHLAPQRHWTLYLQPSAHVDIGYTDLQERVVQLHTANMDLALDLCETHSDFRWNTEAAWVQDQYLAGATQANRARFSELARKGQIGCSAIYGNMLTGICSGEELVRSLYFAHDYAVSNGVPFDIAMSSDVPTQVWSLPSVLAGSGIRYFSAGLNLTRGDSFNRLFARSPFWWEGPDGARVLTWFAPGYAYAQTLGLASGIERARSEVGRFLSGFDRPDYPYDAALGFGGFSDNQPLSPTLAQTVEEWNSRYAFPRIVLCRGPEFFEHIEHKFARSLPVLRGCGGTYWEDGAASSARETALNIHAREALVTAEMLHATQALDNGGYPLADFNAAWKQAILYDEHTWGAAQSISEPASFQTRAQWDTKQRFALESRRQARELVVSGLRAAVRPGAGQVVFNPHSWPYTGPAEVAETGQPAWAQEVPPLGFALVTTVRPRSRDLAADESVLENAHYRLKIDRTTGAVRSLLDKNLKLELAEQGAPYGLSQYVYVAGQGDACTDATAIVGVQVERLPHPFGQMLRVSGRAFRTPSWTTEIVLYDDIKRIDFLNRIVKEETCEKEAGYFAFPFALERPEFYISIPNAVVRPKRDMLDGACMAWYCAQDYVAVADDSACIIWSAWDSPLVTLGDVNREKLVSPIPLESGRLFAYVFNNYWFTNYKASQGGQMEFRFSLTSMPRYDPVAATRFGREVRSVPIAVAGKPRLAQPLGSVSPDGVIVQAVKMTQRGDGLAIRLREVAGKRTNALLRLPKGSEDVWLANLVEDRLRPLEVHRGCVRVSLPASGMATVIARPAGRH